jgi:Ca2+-binding RTX toxin-like protein
MGRNAMATFTYSALLPADQWIPDFFEPNNEALITARFPTRLGWTNVDGTRVELNGTGMTYSNGDVTGGTITQIVVRNAANVVIMSINQLAADAVDLYYLAFGYDRPGGDREDAHGFDFMSTLSRGNDIINGSNNGDEITGGRNIGNDTINAFGGDDFIHGDAGNDIINGGLGFDTLAYQESFFDPTAFRGVIINMVTRTVVDCWGGSDRFTSIEGVRGSKFADSITGDSLDNELMGLRGADVINGGLGYDTVQYWRDSRFGGDRGIIANLSTGRIIDGFGQTDIVSGIEQVEGTDFNDIFVGSANRDRFLGGRGVDSYNGGLGDDQVNFSWGPAITGAVVNLNLATLQVTNDGFGNAETLVSIEDLDGNELNDRLTGNALDNSLAGDRGNDVLIGGGGNDFIAGDAGADAMAGGTGSDTFFYDRREGNNPFGDFVIDFVSGQDKIEIFSPDFAGMGNVVRFVNGTAAGGTGSWFFFNTVTDQLFWDADGTGAGTAIRIATLIGVVSMTAADIVLDF